MTIIYQTNTGSSKQYAEMLSEKISVPAVALSDSKDISADEEIIFIGWLMAGAVQGLDKIREKFTNVKCICAVGLTVNEKAKAEVTEKNQITEPLFLLQGNFHIDRLKGMYKMMMSMMMKMLKSKLKESKDPKADQMLEAFEKGVDMVSEDKLDEVIEFLNS